VKARQSQRPVTDGACAQKRRSLRIRIKGGDGESKVLRHRHILRVSARHISSGRLKVRAEIFPAVAAIPAFSTGRTDPADADPLAFGKFNRPRAALLHDAYNLMPQNKGEGGRRRPAFDFIEFRVTDAAGGNANQNLLFTGHRIGNIHKRKRLWIFPNIRDFLQNSRFHFLSRLFPPRGCHPVSSSAPRAFSAAHRPA